MPIYAYRCESCGHALDALQKVSDPVLTKCPQCGAEALRKQVTAAGFQLKGSGWYVTDFRGGSQPPASDAKSGSGAGSEQRADANGAQATAPGADGKPAAKEAPAPAPAPAAAPAAPAASGATPKPAA